MFKIFVFTHPSVEIYASGEVAWFIAMLREWSDKTVVEHYITNVVNLNSVNPGSIVFLFGQETKLTCKSNGSFVIYVCLSAFLNARGFLSQSINGFRLLRRRKLKFKNNILPFIDGIIDFYPKHTDALRRKYGKRLFVGSFLPNSLNPPSSFISLPNRKYDICIVGSPTARRRRVWKELERLGLKLSPYTSKSLHQTIADSRLVLNIHSELYDNLELPRIIAAFKCGTSVLTEKCHGMEDVIPSDLIFCESYRKLSSTSLKLSANSLALSSMASYSQAWLEEKYNMLTRMKLLNTLESLKVCSLARSGHSDNHK
jgi:hypothetical protein